MAPGVQGQPLHIVYKDARIKASTNEIAQSLQGSWRAEHLFALKQALALFDFYATQLAECDAAIEAQLQVLAAHSADPQPGKKRSRSRNAPKFDLRSQGDCVSGKVWNRYDGSPKPPPRMNLVPGPPSFQHHSLTLPAMS